MKKYELLVFVAYVLLLVGIVVNSAGLEDQFVAHADAVMSCAQFEHLGPHEQGYVVYGKILNDEEVSIPAFRSCLRRRMDQILMDINEYCAMRRPFLEAIEVAVDSAKAYCFDWMNRELDNSTLEDLSERTRGY